MADPRTDALMRALGGGGSPMPEEQSGYGEMPNEGEQDSPENAAAECLERLQPFMDDPRIAKAAMSLQEIAGGPEAGAPDTDMAMAPEAGMMPGQI